MNKISIRNPFPIIFALLLTAILLVLVTPGWAQSTTKFNDGYLSVFKVTSGSALTNTGTQIVIEEYLPTGASQSSPNYNTSLATGSSGVVVSGSAGSAGAISRSENGRYLIIPGYAANIGAANSTFNTNGTARTLNGSGTLGTGIVGSFYTTNNDLRGATSDDGTNFWFSGGSLGVRYSNNGSTVATVSATSTNTRVINIFNGQLYFSTASGSGTHGAYQVGNAKPTTTGQTSVGMAIGTNLNPYGFAVSPDYLTIYAFNGANNIVRHTYSGSYNTGTGVYSGGSWSAASTGFTLTAATGVAVDWNGYAFATGANGAKIYACNASTLVAGNDNGTGAISTTTLRTITVNPTFNNFRGLAFSPVKQTVSLGANTPATSTITTGTNDNVLFQFKLAADEGNSTLKKVIVAQTGTATIGSGNSISNFRLIEDANNDGIAQSGEISTVLSTGTVASTNITFSSITLSSYINEGASKNFLVIGNVSGTGSGTFIPSIVSNKTLNSVNYTTNITNAGGSWLNIGTTAPTGNTLTISGGTTTVNLAISPSTGTEAGTTSITLTLSSGAAVSGSQTVDVTLSGTGLTSADFTSVDFSSTVQITIPNGGTSGTLTFTVTDDILSEGTETATFTISNPTSGITLGSTTSQNLSITDNDNPVISLSALSGSAFCTATGTASGYQTFTVSGDYLTGNLTVTPPTGFEVSTDGGSTYGTSQSVPVSGGNVTSEPLTVRVRIAASASAGTPSGNVAVAGGGATSQTVAVSGTVGTAVNLAVGDISIIGFRSDASDAFSFVNWVSIPTGTVLYFTDIGWDGSQLTGSEQTVTWTNTGSAIAPGTVIVVTDGVSDDQTGTTTSGDLNGISATNDNIFVYQGNAACPSFIFGFANAAWITSGGITSNDSYLPTSLNVANGNINVTSLDNWENLQPRNNQANISDYKPIVNLASNWTGNDTPWTLSSTDFTVGSIPAVNLTVSSNTTTETGAPAITATLTAASAVSGDQTVTLTVTGTNITTTDYQLNSITQSTVTITILSGQTTGTASFNILDDSNVEGPETAILTISSPSSGIILGTTTAQNIAISDNDGTIFYSQSGGNFDGAIWATTPVGTPATALSLGDFSSVRDIVIQTGHNVILNVSSKSVQNLTVQSTASLVSNTANNNPIYLNLYGSITNNGTFGNATNGISLNAEGSSCSLNGNPYNLVRIRKNTSSPATSTLTINADATLRYYDPSGEVCIYNNTNNSNLNIIINSGKTVNVSGNGTSGTLSIDGTDGISSGERGGIITVNGSLIVTKKIIALSNNTIPGTYPCSIVIGSSGTITTYNIDLSISAGFTAFTINSGGTITVNNNFAVQGGTLTTNNGVILNSGGSLMHGTSTPSGGGSVSGNITIKRQGTTSADKYNYWSSPVSGGTLPGSGGYSYNSSLGTNGYTDDNNPSPDPGWAAFSGSMTNGKGYASKGANLASFTGAPNNGSISVGVTSSGQPLSSTTAPSKFNLIGNPYPCGLTAFDATNGLVNNNSGVIAGSLYFWYDDGSVGTDYAANDYGVRTGVGGTAANSGGPTPSNNIGAGQGFIVEAIATGSVNFSNNMRNNNNSQFFKTEEDTFMNRIWLTLSNADLYNEILIAFKSDATEERDLLYDAYKLRGNSQITFAAVQQEDEFAIVAFPPVTDERIIPLTTYVTTPGNYTITNKYAEYMETIPVYLEDRLLGTYTDISNNGTYAAYMSEENSVDRFFLHFAPLATSIPEVTEAKIKTYSSGNELIVLFSNFNESTATLRVIDMTGKEVFAQQNANLKSNFISINTGAFAAGIYAVNLITETNSYTVKTFVK